MRVMCENRPDLLFPTAVRGKPVDEPLQRPRDPMPSPEIAEGAVDGYVTVTMIVLKPPNVLYISGKGRVREIGVGF